MRYENNLLAIVVLGRQNPAILSHEFLIRTKIIDGSFPQPTPTITPIIANLQYPEFVITIEPEKYQISQKTNDPNQSILTIITLKY